MLKEKIQDMSAFGGDPVYVLFMLIAFLGGVKKEFLILLVGLALAYAITFAIRMFWWQERPDKEKYKNIWEKFDSGSFPSVHAMRATILALTLAMFYKTALAYAGFAVVVLAVCFARVWLKRHRLIDVAVGVPLGVLIYWLAPRIINALG